MLSIQDFVREELNDKNLISIYQGLLENIYGGREQLEIVFNRFSVEIDFNINQVSIFDDILMEDTLKMNIESFFNLIRRGSDSSLVDC